MNNTINCAKARTCGLNYLQKFVEGKWESWEEAASKCAIERNALLHLSTACLHKDWDCDRLLSLIHKTGYLTREEMRVEIAACKTWQDSIVSDCRLHTSPPFPKLAPLELRVFLQQTASSLLREVWHNISRWLRDYLPYWQAQPQVIVRAQRFLKHM